MSRTTGYDAFTSQEVFRKDHKQVIATKRELALILPVRLAPRVGGGNYAAGQTLAQYTSAAGSLENLFVNYDNAGGSGRETAKCILMFSTESQDATAAASANAAPAIFKGIVFKDALVGWDSNAATDLGAREILSSTGTTLINF